MKSKKLFFLSFPVTIALACASCDEDTGKPLCNHNGVLEKGESCDGNQFGSLTCKDIDPSRPEGNLRCSDKCVIISDDCTQSQTHVCGDKVKSGDEQCDGPDFGGKTCKDIDPSRPGGKLSCSDKCVIISDDCTQSQTHVCGDKVKSGDEQCDGPDFGGKTCHDADPTFESGYLNCTQDCKFDTTWCFNGDAGLQAPLPKAESTDEICSNGLNDYSTVDKQGKIAKWFDCKNHWCTQLPIVQVCGTLENTNELCSNGKDDPMKPRGSDINGNDLTDCDDPSCFKNPRVTICHKTKPVKWEFGSDCKDGHDNDGDTLADCTDPDCLHAGVSDCELGSLKRILFDNAHHQVAGNADWIVDVTGRHPFPSKPSKEDEWHGYLSSWGKALMDTGSYVLETLPQNRTFTYGTDNLQDLKHYHILISTDPSVNYSDDEIEALYQFVNNGGSVFFIADHFDSDRDGNTWDSVRVLNDMSDKLKAKHGSNPFAFTALQSSSMDTVKTQVSEDAATHPVIKGKHGTVLSVASYAGTAFEVESGSTVQTLLTLKGKPYAIAGKVGTGRFVAVGDSSIAGDATNSLGVKQNRSGFDDPAYSNKIFLMNAVEWLAGTD